MTFAKPAPLPRSTSNHSDNFMSAILAPCNAKSIAPYEFAFLAFGYPIDTMKTVGQIRRENLLLLIEEHGSLANLNERLDLPRTDATLSQIKNQSTTSRGKPKMMGEALARRIEGVLKLQLGWMDNDHAPPSYRQQRIDTAIKAMENMADWQFDQASRSLIRLLNQRPSGATAARADPPCVVLPFVAHKPPDWTP